VTGERPIGASLEEANENLRRFCAASGISVEEVPASRNLSNTLSVADVARDAGLDPIEALWIRSAATM
jgi:hypothetical protein